MGQASATGSTPSLFPTLAAAEAVTADDIPDECFASIFQSLSTAARNRCSLVCRRWHKIEGQSRHRLSLKAESNLLPLIPSIFSRFDSVTKLTLRCDSQLVSIGDEALILISRLCPNLTRLKIRACRELTDAGLEAFAENCKGLKKFSCGSCTFGLKGMNALMHHCGDLEELSAQSLRGITDDIAADGGGVAVSSLKLKSICLKDTVFFYPTLGAKNLTMLKLTRCYGDWDNLFHLLVDQVPGIVKIHLEMLQISDVGLKAISKCSSLETLHLVKNHMCTDAGLVAVAEGCELLRELHVDGWKFNCIGDKGLIAVAECCPNLQELVLIGMNPTKASLEMLASNCRRLERLALRGSDSVGDREISCIAVKCVALKELCIEKCPVSDRGMEALAFGCPNLVKLNVKKCKGVTGEWLKFTRGPLAINLGNVYFKVR
ncbi:F-box protein [Spatholobus suberectus]|nr:F-box protein [Spatholobus suberectus]